MPSVTAEKIIGKWTTPLQGILRGLPPYMSPEDALWDGSNVLVREGALVPRPGFTIFDNTALGARPVGAIAYTGLGSQAYQTDAFQNDAFQVSSGESQLLVAVTSNRIWVYFGGLWRDISDASLNAPAQNWARITGIQIGSTISIVITNGNNTPRSWDSVSATTAVIAGSPPLWTDVCTASDRIVGIVPPYTVRWGNSLSLATWPALNVRNLSDTLDPVVAIRNLGTLGLVVYKEKTIWIGQPGGATDASYFSFVIRGFYDGPATPTAVVDADGLHVYMTNIGRVGAFDGSQHQWVCDGVWPIVRADLDQQFARHIFGVFEPLHREVYFYYPRKGDSGLCKGLVIVKLPNLAEGIDRPIGFRGTVTFPVSIGTDFRSGSRKALVFGDQTQKAYTAEGALDDAAAFSGFWQPGLLAVPGLDPMRVEGFETFAERGQGFGTLTAKIVKNDLLENPSAAPSATAQAIDLSEIVPTQPRGGDVRGRFFGLRYEFVTPITLRWYGSRLAARQIEPMNTQGR